jgi:hypothetical protein
MKTRLIILLLAAVLLAGCNLPLIGVSPTPSPTASARPRSTATLTLLQPQPNTVVTQSTVHVEFQLTGGRVVNVVSKNLTPDTGHIHLSIDGRLISMNYQLSQDVSMQPFAPGPHVLQGEFVAVDHAPFNPRVITKVIIEYQPPGSSS